MHLPFYYKLAPHRMLMHFRVDGIFGFDADSTKNENNEAIYILPHRFLAKIKPKIIRFTLASGWDAVREISLPCRVFVQHACAIIATHIYSIRKKKMREVVVFAEMIKCNMKPSSHILANNE